MIHKKGLFKLDHPKAFEAIVYGLKFKGCSISEKEVQALSRM